MRPCEGSGLGRDRHILGIGHLLGLEIPHGSNSPIHAAARGSRKRPEPARRCLAFCPETVPFSCKANKVKGPYWPLGLRGPGACRDQVPPLTLLSL